ncbi:N-acetyltransferase [Staphylococcus gallinarum]|uniref:GNAT family N-acetyltransferase n=1 Tax=Staphylococcus gallinarum TaxID=1293 RepID=UPI000D1CFF82|nr:GNAT family N-acetyltransferase [Staphylococcus gallinarum]PTE35760.1 N-acetyltransferase [Staphylococcus gallinarum]
MNNSISLEKVTWDNIDQILQLSIKKEQYHYVASTSKSLALAHVFPGKSVELALKIDNKYVGYSTIVYDESEKSYLLWHFLIDRKYQNNRYGTQGVKAIIEYLLSNPFADTKTLLLTVKEENNFAYNMYSSAGFIDSYNKDDYGENIMYYNL